jgi:hypothetical protein
MICAIFFHAASFAKYFICVSFLHCKQLCVFTFFRFGDHARALEGKIVGKFIKKFYEVLAIKEHPLFYLSSKYLSCRYRRLK